MTLIGSLYLENDNSPKDPRGHREPYKDPVYQFQSVTGTF